MVLHRKGDQALLTATWQRQDEAPLQSEQAVRDGQLLVQTVVPGEAGGGLLVAMASPRAGAVETDVPGTGRAVVDEPGLAVWQVPAGAGPGSVLLSSQGDGVLYHSKPARRS